jgi:hypothetical protein
LLEVISQPGGALVSLDDEPLGQTNPTSGRLVKRDVAPGRHHVRIALEGHQELSQAVELAAGGTTTLHAPLARKTEAPVPQLRPGVVAALAAGAGALALGLWLRARRRAQPLPDAGTASRRFRARPRGGATPARAEAATPTPEGALPAPFGEFLLLERIGRGGMASVFKAERQGELRALKRPRASVIDDPLFLERFLREAEIGRTLHHPNIIRIYERGDADGQPYFTMELIEGRDALRAAESARARSSRANAVHAVLQIAEALDYAHSKGVVHRDLKPSNTMRRPRRQLEGDGLRDRARAALRGHDHHRLFPRQPRLRRPREHRGQGRRRAQRSLLARRRAVRAAHRAPAVRGRDLVRGAAEALRRAAPAPSKFADGVPPELGRDHAQAALEGAGESLRKRRAAAARAARLARRAALNGAVASRSRAAAGRARARP